MTDEELLTKATERYYDDDYLFNLAQQAHSPEVKYELERMGRSAYHREEYNKSDE
jgi:hypothetical protein